jgi:glutamate carboxypeptidase
MNPIEQVLGESTASATERILTRLRRYVEHESPSYDEQRCAALAQMIAHDAATFGCTTELLDAPGRGKHVLIDFNPGAPPRRPDPPAPGRPGAPAPRRPDAPNNQPHLLILTHLDTVHPVGTIESQPFAVVGDRVTGPGVFDMKSGLTLMLEAIALLQRTGTPVKRPIRMLVTCDEEIGSHTSREAIEATARGARAVLVPEPSLPGGKAKTARKGVATFRLIAHGRAAHAGIEPEKGVNAILEIAQQIVALQALGNRDLGTTVSVGTVNGGTSTNVVPAHAEANIDVRFAQSSEGERVQHALLNLRPLVSGASVEVKPVDTRPPLERTPAVVGVYEQARSIARDLGYDLGEASTGGGSDGCLTAAIGVPTLDGIGPQGGGAHAVDEHVLIADLPFRLALFVQLLQSL